MSDERWRGWENAEIYDRFVRDWPIYRWLNARLAERAELEDAHRVLDLGCGTGASTHASLQHLPAEAEIVGIDASPEMVEVARAHTLDPRARFLVAPALRLGEVVEGPFDRVISNAAFWQLAPVHPLLRTLRPLLREGARLVFNIPTDRILGRRAELHPFQVALARAIETHTDEPFTATAAPFDLAELRAAARESGLELEAEEILTYRGIQAEFMELMAIPALIAPLTPGLSAEEVERVLAPARAQVHAEEQVVVPWSFFALRVVG